MKSVTVTDIRDNAEKLQVRMTTAQLVWWKEMADRDQKRNQWEALTPEDWDMVKNFFFQSNKFPMNHKFNNQNTTSV